MVVLPVRCIGTARASQSEEPPFKRLYGAILAVGKNRERQMNLREKAKKLQEILAQMESVLVAYSGGADSTLLLRVAQDTLGDRVLAITAKSAIYPQEEIEASQRVAKKLGVKHIIIETEELTDPNFVGNPPDRCYYCKRELFSRLMAIARENNLNYVLDGSNYDDLGDLRPGMKAAQEFGVRSPLQEAKFTKDDIRRLSQLLGLPTWDKPSLACLASRLPYGNRITEDVLSKIQQAEAFVRNLGLTQVRVRHHNQIARIEVLKEEIPVLLQKAEEIVLKLKELGYLYVTVDLQGYRTGSMNEAFRND